MKEELISKELQFYSFVDFFKKKDKIKKHYQTLDIEQIRIYKMYVYSTSFETEYAKDLIWEFLNSVEYSDFGIFKEYRKRKTKR